MFLFTQCYLAFGQVEFPETPVFGFSYTIDADLQFPVVREVSPGSPAQLAGMERGDVLTTINGISLKGMQMEAIGTILKNQSWKHNTLKGNHENGVAFTVSMDKARMITAQYKAFRYTIFLDSLYHPIFDPASPCSYATDDCKNGYGYYVFDNTQAFFGELENNNLKDGLFYFLTNGKPCYYLGEFVQNQYDGKGTIQYVTNNNEVYLYTGDFARGSMNGQGELFNASHQLIYSGGFSNAEYNGYGKYFFPDGAVVEGLWEMGTFKGSGDGYASTEIPDNTGYTEEQIKEADILRKAGLTEAEIRKFFDYLNTPVPHSQEENAVATTSDTELQEVINQLNAENNAQGYTLRESFDVGFSRYQVANCFTSCSEYKRKIYMVIEGGLTDLQTTTLNVQYAYGSNDIGNHDLEEELDNHFPFIFTGYSQSYQIYNCNMITDDLHTACTYQWQVQSMDETLHYVHVLIYSGM